MSAKYHLPPKHCLQVITTRKGKISFSMAVTAGIKTTLKGRPHVQLWTDNTNERNGICGNFFILYFVTWGFFFFWSHRSFLPYMVSTFVFYGIFFMCKCMCFECLCVYMSFLYFFFGFFSCLYCPSLLCFISSYFMHLLLFIFETPSCFILRERKHVDLGRWENLEKLEERKL